MLFDLTKAFIAMVTYENTVKKSCKLHEFETIK